MKLTKPVIAILERCFAAEIGKGPGVVHIKTSKALDRAIGQGLVEPATVKLAPDKSCPWPIAINGYRLTTIGNYEYSKWCGENVSLDEDDPEDIQE